MYKHVTTKELHLSALYKISKFIIDVTEKNHWIEKQNKSLSLRMLNKQISTSNKAKLLLEKHEKNIRIYKLNAQQCKLLINQANTYREDKIITNVESANDKIAKISNTLSKNINILESFYTSRLNILNQYISFFEVVEHFQKNLEFVQTIYADKLPDDKLKALRAMEKLATARLKTSKNLQNTLDKGRILLKTLRQSKTNILAITSAAGNFYNMQTAIKNNGQKLSNSHNNNNSNNLILKEIDPANIIKDSCSNHSNSDSNSTNSEDMGISLEVKDQIANKKLKKIKELKNSSHNSQQDKIDSESVHSGESNKSNHTSSLSEELDNNSASIEYIQKMLDTLGKYPSQLENVWMEKEIRVDLWCNYWVWVFLENDES